MASIEDQLSTLLLVLLIAAFSAGAVTFALNLAKLLALTTDGAVQYCYTLSAKELSTHEELITQLKYSISRQASNRDDRIDTNETSQVNDLVLTRPKATEPSADLQYRLKPEDIVRCQYHINKPLLDCNVREHLGNQKVPLKLEESHHAQASDIMEAQKVIKAECTMTCKPSIPLKSSISKITTLVTSIPATEQGQLPPGHEQADKPHTVCATDSGHAYETHDKKGFLNRQRPSTKKLSQREASLVNENTRLRHNLDRMSDELGEYIRIRDKHVLALRSSKAQQQQMDDDMEALKTRLHALENKDVLDQVKNNSTNLNSSTIMPQTHIDVSENDIEVANTESVLLADAKLRIQTANGLAVKLQAKKEGMHMRRSHPAKISDQDTVSEDDLRVAYQTLKQHEEQLDANLSSYRSHVSKLEGDRDIALMQAQKSEQAAETSRVELNQHKDQSAKLFSQLSVQQAQFDQELITIRTENAFDSNKLKQEIQDLSVSYERLTTERDLAHGQLAQVQIELKQKDETLSNLKRDLLDNQSRVQLQYQSAQLFQQLDFASQNISKLEEQNRQLSLGLSQSTEECCLKVGKIAELESEAAAVKTKSEETDELYQEILADNAKSEEEIELLKVQLDNEKTRHKACKIDMEAQLLNLQSQLASQRAEDAAAYGQLQVAMTSQIGQLQIEHSQARHANDEYNKQLSLVQITNDTIATERDAAHQEVRALQHENQFLNRRIEDRDARIANLEEELNNVEGVQEENRRLQGHLNQIQPRVDYFDELLKQRLNELQRRHSEEWEKKEKELKEVRASLKQTQIKRDEHHRDAVEFNRQLNHIKAAPPVSDEQLRQDYEAKLSRMEEEVWRERIARATAQARLDNELKKRITAAQQTPIQPVDSSSPFSISRSSTSSPSTPKAVPVSPFPSATQKRLDRQIELTRQTQDDLSQVRFELNQARLDLKTTTKSLEDLQRVKDEEITTLKRTKEDELHITKDDLFLKNEELERIRTDLRHVSKMKENIVENLHIQLRTLTAELAEARAQLPRPPSPGKKRVHDETDEYEHTVDPWSSREDNQDPFARPPAQGRPLLAPSNPRSRSRSPHKQAGNQAGIFTDLVAKPNNNNSHQETEGEEEGTKKKKPRVHNNDELDYLLKAISRTSLTKTD